MSGKTVYIVLFRGVGGATQLPTAPLRAALTDAGFENVATYINSGNAVVKSAKPRATVVAEIADLCRKAFGFDKDIHIVTREEWAALIEANPFPNAEAGKHLHAAVLAGDPPKGALDRISRSRGRRRGDQSGGQGRLSAHAARLRAVEIRSEVR